MFNTKLGFTLVELAIVIVIIGLLVGGVLQGQELIKSSRINSTMSKIQSYNAAVNSFRAKYDALPGDIANASKVGLNTAKGDTTVNVCSTPTNIAVTATAGGNGNGNNVIEGHGGLTACTQTAFNASFSNQGVHAHGGEVINFFVHLSNGLFIKESFNQASSPAIAGEQYPKMPVGTGMIALSDGGLVYWLLGAPNVKGSTTLASVIGNNLTPTEASTIDSKLDDGNPTTGITQAVSAYDTNFTIAPPSATLCVFTGGATYNTGGSVENSKLCTIRIQSNF